MMVEIAEKNDINSCDLKVNSAKLQNGQDSSIDYKGRCDNASTNCSALSLKSSNSQNCDANKAYQCITSKTSPKKHQYHHSRHCQRLKRNNNVKRSLQVSSNEDGDKNLEHCISSEGKCNRYSEEFVKDPVLKRCSSLRELSVLTDGTHQQQLHNSTSGSEMYSNSCKNVPKCKSFSDVTTINSQSLHNYSLNKLHLLHKSFECADHNVNSSLNSAMPELQKPEQVSETSVEVEEKLTEHNDNSVNKSADAVWKTQHSRSKSDGNGILDSGSFTNESHICADGVLSASLPSVLSEKEQQKKKSIFEGGAVVVPTECFFPRPQPGQTLTSFLSSDFNICAELDRENAHFCISEALISAIEQIKCTETMRIVAEEAESDEEIRKLTQRIRIRRRERLQEKATRNSAFLNGGRTDTTTTSQSVSPVSTSHSSDFDAGDSIGSDDEEIADLDLSDHDASNLKSMKESGLSLSLASMYSDADIHKGPFAQPNMDVGEKRLDIDIGGAHTSAEAVALSLLKRFSEKQLPKASDLEWLVSEQDAPQRLLPLPDSWPISPDAIDEEYDLEKTRLRGNLEWAPPRQQIIFIIHPEPKRKDAILKQNYRCAGCGMKIERCYIKKFRYCDYLGKFFCQCCHANNLACIPGRILWKWDFRQYYVSKFSWKLLDQMFCDPLFNVMDINSKLYRKIRQLDLCREYRMQLFYLKDFIRTCRNSEQIQKEFEQMPEHIYCEPDLYSLSDFLKVKNGELSRLLNSLISRCTSHIKNCVLCQAKGFICEMCKNSSDIIFPFQFNKVCHCIVCGSCFHKRCFKPGICPKCVRIQDRRKKLEEQKEVLYSDEEV